MKGMNEELSAMVERAECFARGVLAQQGLTGWTFGWDRAKRRLGLCRLQERHISLSIYFVRANLQNWHEIEDTILHEVAHALAWSHHRVRTHGEVWQRICRQLGAQPHATAGRDAMAPLPYRYAVRVHDTGEVVARYYRRPRFAKYIKRMALKHRPETLGRLVLVPLAEEREG